MSFPVPAAMESDFLKLMFPRVIFPLTFFAAIYPCRNYLNLMLFAISHIFQA
jgi:hypothetical protein